MCTAKGERVQCLGLVVHALASIVPLAAGADGSGGLKDSLGALFGCSASACAFLFKSGTGCALADAPAAVAVLLAFSPAMQGCKQFTFGTISGVLEHASTSTHTCLLLQNSAECRGPPKLYTAEMERVSDANLRGGLCRCHTPG